MSTDRDYLAAGLALGGLSDAELSEAHGLANSDADFRAEVASYAEIMAEVAESDEPQDVAADTRAAILRIPQTHAQDSSAERSNHEQTGTDPANSDSAGPASLADHRSRRSRRRSWLPYAAAAAALVVIAGLGGAIWQQQQRQNELADELATAQQQLGENTRLMEADDLKTSTAELPEGGSVIVLSSESQQLIRLSPRDVGAPPAGKSMQMWVIGDEGPKSAGLMTDRPVTIGDRAFAKGSLFGITVEPEGGSDQPTTDPIVAIGL